MGEENSLEMTKEQFLKLPTPERDVCVFENICDLKKLVSGYKFYQKLSAVIGSVLVAGMGILFLMHIK